MNAIHDTIVRRLPRTVAGSATLLLVVGFGACGGDGSDTGRTASVRDSAGVRIVENPTEGAWGEAGWTVEQVLSIGEAAGDADYQFGQVTGVATLSDGRIAVLDQQAQRVQIYAPDGTYERTIGQPGNGPGEFSQGAMALFVGRGDTIVVPDMGNQRVTLIPPDGAPTSFPLRMELGVPVDFQMDFDGALVTQRRMMNLPGGAAADADEDLVVSQAYDGTIVDTLLTPKRGRTFEMTEQGPSVTLFSPEPAWAVLDDGRVASAVSDTFRIEIHSPTGRLESIVTFPRRPQPVTERDEEVIFDLVRSSMEENGAPPQMIDRMLDGMTVADRWPVFARLRAGPGGTLWAQRVRTVDSMSDEELESWNPRLDQGGPEWDVFEPDGRYGGVVELPARFTPMSIEDDRIYGVFRDDFDVQTVRVYALGGEEPTHEDT